MLPSHSLQADRALWDARAAMLLLLMGRCTKDDAAMEVRGEARVDV